MLSSSLSQLNLLSATLIEISNKLALNLLTINARESQQAGCLKV